MTYLLDVNVLIALIDPDHVSHEAAHEWFATHAMAGWATCPITENGLVRIVGHSRYPNTPGPPSLMIDIVRTFRAHSGHSFWPDDISLIDPDHFEAARLLKSTAVTDAYLLALAKSRGGQLATFDRKLDVAAVKDAAAALHIVGTDTVKV